MADVPVSAASKPHLSQTERPKSSRSGMFLSSPKLFCPDPGPHDPVTLTVPLDFEDGRTDNPRRGKRQSPLETSVQRLRNTRCFEEICAWNEAAVQFFQKPCMHG